MKFNYLKIFFPVWVFLLGMTSCGLFKKAPKDDKVYNDKLEEIEGKRVYNPETGKYEEVKVVTQKVDTVQWTDVSEEEYPPITNIEGESGVDEPSDLIIEDITNLNTETKTAYNVALVLPFLGQNYDVTADKIYEKSKWALNFYAGAKQALAQLESEEVNLNISVHDSKMSDGQVIAILNKPELRTADLVIGGYRKNIVNRIAGFAKMNDITYVSPHSASAKISKDNPNYLQVSPTLETHCEAMLKHARKDFQPEQIVLVAKDNRIESKRFRYFNKANRALAGTDTIPDLRELLIPADLSEFHEDSIRPYLDAFKTTAFLVPSFSDETFVSNFLRMLNIAKDAQPVRVYGLPQWMEYHKVEYDYFENLDVHFTSGGNRGSDSSEINAFKNEFFNAYGEVPEKEAFLGYDLMLYCGRMMNRYGTKFQTRSNESIAGFLQRQFNFQPNLRIRAAGAEVPPIVDQFENKQVYILKFENYQFQKSE